MNIEVTVLVDSRISKVTAAAEPVGSSIAIAMSLEQIVLANCRISNARLAVPYIAAVGHVLYCTTVASFVYQCHRYHSLQDTVHTHCDSFY